MYTNNNFTKSAHYLAEINENNKSTKGKFVQIVE